MASRKGPRVIRIPRIESDEQFVLIQVSSEGHDHRGLKLIGTEGENVFSISMKHAQVLKQKKSSSINQEQWDELLSAILFGTLPEDGGDITEDVEAIAKVNDSYMTVIIQKKVEGITSKYGEISLPAIEEEIEIFDWCGLTAQSRDQYRDELQNLKSILKEKDAQIKKLEASLAELVQLKTENENQLLEKFSLLLNEKKLKIRDQQRLLASTSVDPAKVEAVEDTRSVQSRSAGPSRKGKRKADKTIQPQSEDESDAGFEKMDVDEVAKESEPEVQTPDASTADDTESDDGLEPVLPPVRKSAPLPSEDAMLPPKRQLPFVQKAKPPAKAPTQNEGSETESGEDDEL